MVGGVSLINEATTSSKNQTTALKKKLFRSRMLKGRLKRLSAFPVSQYWGGLYLYYDERRDIRWNIAWARGKSRGRSPRDFPRAQAIFHRISRLESQYRHSQLPNNGSAAAIVVDAVIAVVACNLNLAVAVELIASVEAVFAAMLTCSQSNIPSHSH